MKKYILIFVATVGLLMFQLATAGDGNMVRIQNNTDNTIYPFFMGSVCMSDDGNGDWPSSIPAHTTTTYVYTETDIGLHCLSGSISLDFEMNNHKFNWVDLWFLTTKVELGAHRPQDTLKNDGNLSHDWDYATFIINK